MLLNPLLVIPARLNSTRLPRKVMADIEGKTMVRRVYEQCVASQIGQVIVACDSQEIADEINAIGGHAVLTDPELPSGSDRAYSGISLYDPEYEFDAILCVQADIPTIDPKLIRLTLETLNSNPTIDIATLANPILNEDDLINPNIVKIALAGDHNNRDQYTIMRALYFSRTPIPFGTANKYHHIGLYAYKRASLERYIKLQPSPLEISEKLEQLRALEDGMHIAVSIVDTYPLGEDTSQDLEKARLYYRNMYN